MQFLYLCYDFQAKEFKNDKETFESKAKHYTKEHASIATV